MSLGGLIAVPPVRYAVTYSETHTTWERVWFHDLKSGYIWHERGNKAWVSRAIRSLLGSWGNHDGLLIRAEDGTWYVGEATMMHGVVLTPLSAKLARIRTGEIEVRILRPIRWTSEVGKAAADYFVDHLVGKPYDFRAILSFLLAIWFKLSFRRFSKTIAEWEWAEWCTESTHHAYLHGPLIDLWQKEDPTPLTSEHRINQTLADISRLCVGGLPDLEWGGVRAVCCDCGQINSWLEQPAPKPGWNVAAYCVVCTAIRSQRVEDWP